MNKLLVLIASSLVLVGSFYAFNNFIYQEKQGDEVPVVSDENADYDAFTDNTTGVTFEYKTAPEEYVVDNMTEFIGNEVPGVTVIKAFRVMNAREKYELENSEVGREGPPTINLLVFENTNRQSASRWVDSVPQYSNIDLVIGEVDRDAVVGGANAVRYRTDGLYLSENVVVTHGGLIYHFTGSFLEEDSTIHNDFKRLVDSVVFIPVDSMPVTSPSPKIDPQVACEGALTYMSFTSGDEADAFVEACVNGEHPEVIERYIDDLGLDGAAI